MFNLFNKPKKQPEGKAQQRISVADKIDLSGTNKEDSKEKELQIKAQSINDSNPIAEDKAKQSKLFSDALLIIICLGLTLLAFLAGNIANGGLIIIGITEMHVSPLILLLLVLVGIFIGGIVGSLIIVGIWKWKSPESLFLLSLRLSKAILVRVHYFNGREVWLKGLIGPNGLTIEANGRVVCVDPKSLGDGDNSFCMGIEIIDVAANNMLAVGLVKALGIFTVEEWYHDPKHKYEVLPFYDDAVVMTLYSLPDSDLAEHCSLWVNYDPSTISWNDMVKYNLHIVPRKDDETEDAFKARCQAEYDSMFGKRDNESDEDYTLRMKPYFDRVKDILINQEVNKLKTEILRLKEETKGRILTSRIFTYHAAMKAMDPRLHYQAYEKLNQIKEAENGVKKQGLPDWIKYIGILFGIGVAGLAILAGVYLVIMAVRGH